MKQIQDWLGHVNFNTIADTYSDLDFSSKVKWADIIYNALDLGNDALLTAYQEMEKYGFNGLDNILNICKTLFQITKFYLK